MKMGENFTSAQHERLIPLSKEPDDEEEGSRPQLPSRPEMEETPEYKYSEILGSMQDEIEDTSHTKASKSMQKKLLEALQEGNMDAIKKEKQESVEVMEEEIDQSDYDYGDGNEEEGCNSQSKRSVLGLDYTIKETQVSTLEEPLASETSISISTCRSSGKRKRYRKKPKVEKTYYCAYCDFNSPRWDRLKEHLIVHLEDRPFVCEVCDFKTKTAKKLKRHLTVHSEERKFECRMCTLTFKRAHTLKEHELTHFKEKLFFCSVCDFSTHRSQYLKRHMMKHTCETLECHLCSFKTVYATLLRRHILIHSGEKIYKCQSCSYSSVYLHCVSQHSKIHEKDSKDGDMYNCGVCDFTTNRTSTLRTHMYVHANGEKRYKCESCEYGSMRKGDLNRHKYKVHKVPKELLVRERPHETYGLSQLKAVCHTDVDKIDCDNDKGIVEENSNSSDRETSTKKIDVNDKRKSEDCIKYRRYTKCNSSCSSVCEDRKIKGKGQGDNGVDGKVDNNYEGSTTDYSEGEQQQ